MTVPRRSLFSASIAGTAAFTLTGSTAPTAATRTAATASTANASFGGWGGADVQAFGDYVSTLPRAALNNGVNFFSLQPGWQYLFLIPVTEAFTSTGCRFVTGATSGIAGAAVTVTAYNGAATGALARVTNPVPAPFTATASYTQVPWGSGAVIEPGWLAIVFTCTAVGATPPRIMTPAANNAAGSGFLNPGVGVRMAAARTSAVLPDVLDVTAGWTPWALPAWLSAY